MLTAKTTPLFPILFLATIASTMMPTSCRAFAVLPPPVSATAAAASATCALSAHFSDDDDRDCCDNGQQVVGRDSFLRTLTTAGLAAGLAASPSAASAKSVQGAGGGAGNALSSLDRERRKVVYAFKRERRLIHAELEFVKELRREMAKEESGRR